MRVVLVRPQEPGNVGSAARVMKNFGLSDLVLVAPQREIDKRAYYMATHAADVVDGARVVQSTAEALTDCTFVLGTTARSRSSQAYDVYTPRDAAARLPREGLAILFGPEASGLSNEDLDYCQAYITIPTGEFSSLNLAQAVNLIAYEFFVTEAEVRSTQPDDLASRERLEHLYALLFETLDYIGYTEANAEGKTRHMYRRIFDRARLTERELNALYGLWRQVKWAVDNKERS